MLLTSNVNIVCFYKLRKEINFFPEKKHMDYTHLKTCILYNLSYNNNSQWISECGTMIVLFTRYVCINVLNLYLLPCLFLSFCSKHIYEHFLPLSIQYISFFIFILCLLSFLWLNSQINSDLIIWLGHKLFSNTQNWRVQAFHLGSKGSSVLKSPLRLLPHNFLNVYNFPFKTILFF